MSRAAIIVAAGLTLTAASANAEMRPHVMNATWAEPETEKPEPGRTLPPPKPATCKLAIMGVSDTRDPAGYMGNWFDQPFHPPADRIAWIKSMAQGLATRGMDLKFTESGSAPAGYAPVTLELKTAWIDSSNGGFQALVKLRIASQDPARPYDKVYRGSFWRTVFMATVGGRSNDALNGAVADALDGIADDANAFCPA
jgi:hypothetical protein